MPTKTIKIELQKAKLNLEGIKQHYIVANLLEREGERSNPKIRVLCELLNTLGSSDKIIIFFNSKKYLTIVHHELTLQGFECDKMMGGKDMDWADRD